MPNTAPIANAISLHRDQPDALQAESDAETGARLLELANVDLTFGILFEHALSNSKIGAMSVAWVRGANEAQWPIRSGV
jgi:hypothetical protein